MNCATAVAERHLRRFRARPECGDQTLAGHARRFGGHAAHTSRPSRARVSLRRACAVDRRRGTAPPGSHLPASRTCSADGGLADGPGAGRECRGGRRLESTRTPGRRRRADEGHDLDGAHGGRVLPLLFTRRSADCVQLERRERRQLRHLRQDGGLGRLSETHIRPWIRWRSEVGAEGTRIAYVRAGAGSSAHLHHVSTAAPT